MQWKFMSTMDLSYKNVTVSNVCLCNKTHSQPFDFVEIGFRISICPMNQMPFLVNFFWPNTPSLEIEKANINWAKFLSKIHFALLEVYPMIVCLATVTPAYNLSKYSWVVVVGNSMNCVHFCNNNSKPTAHLWPRLWPMHIVHWTMYPTTHAQSVLLQNVPGCDPSARKASQGESVTAAPGWLPKSWLGHILPFVLLSKRFLATL